MRGWGFLLGGLLVWAADFFLLYAIASILLTSPLARLLSGIVTLAAMAAAGWLLLRAWRCYRGRGDDLRRWIALVAMLGCGLALLAVAWQGLAAIFS